MPACGSLRAAPLILLAAVAARTEPPPARLLFAGDVMLSREVRRELDLTARDPFRALAPLFLGADLVAGNLEGAVGPAAECIACPPDRSPCFDLRASDLGRLRAAGFTAMGVENNHAGDLGGAGRRSTALALADGGIAPVGASTSPLFQDAGGRTVALLAVDLVGSKDAAAVRLPSLEVARQLRLARALAEVVVVGVHWGIEGNDFPGREQRGAARWLVEQGADVVVGHHPHVLQPVECVEGRPVFYSLGNLLFDQAAEETRRGMVASCEIARDGRLVCGAYLTETPRGSSVPRLLGADPATAAALSPCSFRVRSPLTLEGVELHGRSLSTGVAIEGRIRDGGRWRTRPRRLAGIERARLDGAADPRESIVAIEVHGSTIDGEEAPRPYVYRITPAGLEARWRGSALAWPLVDAVVLAEDETCLCALHRGDAFIAPGPGAGRLRTAVYRWDGFGFEGVADPRLEEACAARFEGSPGR